MEGRCASKASHSTGWALEVGEPHGQHIVETEMQSMVVPSKESISDELRHVHGYGGVPEPEFAARQGQGSKRPTRYNDDDDDQNEML